MTAEVSTSRVVSDSVVVYRVGGREYPQRGNPNCKVCTSPFRFDVEEALIAGRTYRLIVESLPETSGLTVRNVRDHYYNRHLPLEQAASRQIVEHRAHQVGKRIEDGVESLIDGVSLAQVVVQKTFEAIAKGELAVEVKDGMAAAKFLADLGEYDEGGADMEAITEAFMVYHEHAQDHMSPEQFEAFGEALSRNPVLKALAAKYEGQSSDTVPGEVVEDVEDDPSSGEA